MSRLSDLRMISVDSTAAIGLSESTVKAAAELLDEGNTIPFVSRARGIILYAFALIVGQGC